MGTSKQGANEDFAAIDLDARIAVVIDGASGLGKTSVTPAKSDAAWFSHMLGTRMVEHAGDPARGILGILLDAQEETAREYRLFPGSGEVPAIDEPSAGVAAAIWDDDSLHVATLGDCLALVAFSDGSTKVFLDGKLPLLDAKAIDEMTRIANESGMTVRQARDTDAVQGMLVRHRLMRNTEEGYWAADITGKGMAHCSVHSFPMAGVRGVFLCSDGYAAAVSEGLFDTVEELASSTFAGNGEETLRDLRDAEAQDSDMDRWPRFKQSDDASYAIVVFA
ncbi:MAG: protein phosphatase 2C domain-containing protein [Actinomycetota bacterium]|nr:protein phosphatase 2C domain-containing protein [Actinomycetota bacterium]